MGRLSVSQTQAENWLLDDTAMSNALCGYPVYEEYRAAWWSGPLEDADLLAPALLGLHPSPEVYTRMRGRLPALNRALEAIAPNADLAGDASVLPLLARLFEALDGEVGMTTLTAVLHRKRPRLIPLWDAGIRTCYDDTDGLRAENGAFAMAVATAMRADLAAEPQMWHSLAAIADRPPITALRALCIVARHLGEATSAVPEQREPLRPICPA